MTSDRPGSVSIKSLILVPAVISLAITLLRLIGELQNWSPALFSKAAGGGGAFIGISWLIPVFGFYFAWKLAKETPAPGGLGLIGWSLLVVALAVGITVFVARVLKLSQFVQFPIVIVTLLSGAWLVYRQWPLLGRTLLTYGLAARVPVAIVMLIAIYANWGTHYDVPPPNFPEMGPLAKWINIGLVPQMLIWIPTTIIGGFFGGGIALLAGGRSRQPVAA